MKPEPAKRRFVLDTSPDDAPCCIKLECPAADEHTRLYQTDWEFPALARALGWTMRNRGERCTHPGTDGTVSCPDCHRSAGSFIQAARDWLDSRDGRGFLLNPYDF